ncbi:MAG TPA: ATP-binding protein [Edaphobacter sp.]|uniref:ATP-binding protein n=1 Tax=Edaphobacter sp. TaxID=1934404 RepID=UPI002B9A8FC9|nr:ATP-binding protein [Edaphobacter sp.]HUZ94377.1 ATP-binding protein [Edaphobacter sp.]
MSEATVLTFDAPSKLGKVAAVDTSRVLIAVENAILLPRAAVGSLVAIQGTTAQEFLIGMTERVTRQLREQTAQPDPLSPTTLTMEVVPDDALRVVLVGTYRTIEGSIHNRFKRGADTFPQIDRDCFLIEGSNLQRFMALLGKDLDAAQRLELGTFAIDQSAAAIANGDKFFQRHAAILGSTGSGKSWCVSLILERAYARKHVNIVVFDMHGEYSSLATDKSPIASAFKIAGPGDLDSPSDNTLFLPYWLLNREEMLSMILDRSDQNAPNQASRFTLHVRELKEATLIAEKRADVKATFTVDSPVPYELSALIDKLKRDDTEKGVGKNGPVKGEWEGRLTRFVSRLEAKAEDRRYGFMFKPPTSTLKYDWLAKQISSLLAPGEGKPGIKIVDFSEVPSDVLPVVTGVFARLLYDVQFWMQKEKRTPFVFVCDEAHLYLPVKDDADVVERQALYCFERIAKEGRKYGVSLLVVSQRPSDVSRTILSQCNNFLILRLTNDQDQNVVRHLMPDSLAGVLDGLPLLDTGEAVLLGDAILLPARIKLTLPRIEPLSATRDFWKEWGDLASDPAAVRAAVETLRRQSRAASASA